MKGEMEENISSWSCPDRESAEGFLMRLRLGVRRGSPLFIVPSNPDNDSSTGPPSLR
jgi:hypothetical protein